MKYWNGQFAKLNTKEMFSQVDENGDGSIQYNEWMEYWQTVYNSGHSKDEIVEEVLN